MAATLSTDEWSEMRNLPPSFSTQNAPIRHNSPTQWQLMLRPTNPAKWLSVAAAFPSGDLPHCAGRSFWWWVSSCNVLQWMSQSTSSWTRNALKASPTVSTWWPPQISSCASTTLLWKPTWLPWITTDFPALYHLAGRRFNFEMLSGLILCCLFRFPKNLKFLLDFY